MEIISRSEARARGLTHFFTGEKCKRAGHASKRFTSNGACVEWKGLPKAGVVPSQPVEAAPPAYEPDKALHRDPGTRVSQARIDATIERVFNNGPRLALNDAA
jgi:hypothetical protein